MLDYAIYRFGYGDIKWLYPRLEVRDGYIPTYIYIGFWNEMYVGYMAGLVENVDIINIQYTQLVPEFRGTKIVRIIREMIKTIHQDFKNITIRDDSKNNDMIRVLLGAGFHVIGTRTDNNTVFVELLKTDE